MYKNEQTIFSNSVHDKLMLINFYEMFGKNIEVINTTITKEGYTKEAQLLDQNYGVDYRLIINKNKWNEMSYTIQERFRQIKYKKYQDFTIRYETKTGLKSELSKINADFMVYGYANNNKISQIIIVGMSNLKFAFGLNKLPYTRRTNLDNSKFIAFKFSDLNKINAIVKMINF